MAAAVDVEVVEDGEHNLDGLQLMVDQLGPQENWLRHHTERETQCQCQFLPIQLAGLFCRIPNKRTYLLKLNKYAYC